MRRRLQLVAMFPSSLGSDWNLINRVVLPWNEEAQWRVGMSPNISYNWEARGDTATVPIGLGVARLIEIGQLPVNVLVEVDYSVIHPGDTPGSRWDFRVYFTPIIPTFMF